MSMSLLRINKKINKLYSNTSRIGAEGRNRSEKGIETGSHLRPMKALPAVAYN